MDFQKVWEVDVHIRKGEDTYNFDETSMWVSDGSEVPGIVEQILKNYDEPLNYKRFVYPKSQRIELADATTEQTVMAIEWKECRILVDK